MWNPVKDKFTGGFLSFGPIQYEIDFETLQRRMKEIETVYGTEYENFMLKKMEVFDGEFEYLVFGTPRKS